MVKIKTLIICIVAALLVGVAGAGGGVYLYLRDAVERGSESVELAENRAKSMADELRQSLKYNLELEGRLEERLGQIEALEREFRDGGERGQVALDLNKRIEDILRSGKVLE